MYGSSPSKTASFFVKLVPTFFTEICFFNQIIQVIKTIHDVRGIVYLSMCIT